MTLVIAPSGFVEPQVHRAFSEPDLCSLASRISALPEAGLMTFEISYSVVSSGKNIVDFALNAKLDVFLPIWRNVHRRPSSEKREWGRFIAALRFHEGGHVHITRRFVFRMYQNLVSRPAGELEPAFRAQLQELEARHADYDRRTHHGIRQNTPFGTTRLRVVMPAGATFAEKGGS